MATFLRPPEVAARDAATATGETPALPWRPECSCILDTLRNEMGKNRRNRLVAAVVEPVTLADRFDEIRQVFREEKTHLRVAPRRDRKNDFASVLDELADGPKRSSK